LFVNIRAVLEKLAFVRLVDIPIPANWLVRQNAALEQRQKNLYALALKQERRKTSRKA
jgi:hypothetical protein